MAEPEALVTMITIRFEREPGSAPVIVAREHVIWPVDATSTAPLRTTAASEPDDVLAVVRRWLHEHVTD